ncbi:MAG: hypothetical protein IJI14_10460 [Anaerolineaceae bacterium]|nr:hypothetical protein [Anaerolineaceae bacterium]
MNYSELIEEAAMALSNKKGCGFLSAVDYIENLIFNSSCDLELLFKSILTRKYYPADICLPGKSKASKRQFWRKTPSKIREMKFLGMDPAEYAEFDGFCHSKDPEIRTKYLNVRGRFWDADILNNKRRYARHDGFGMFCTGLKEEYYGYFTKTQKRSRYWKKELIKEIADYEINPLKIH